MRIASYGRPGELRAAFYHDEHVIDVARGSLLLTPSRPLPADPGELMAARLLERAAELDRRVEEMLVREGPPSFPPEVCLSRRDVRLGPPLPRPSKVICLGLNYRDHAREQKAKIPERPLLFAKARTAVVGPEDRILLGPGMERVDYELELGVVMAVGGRGVKASAALDAVAGYLVFLDISDREAQFSDRQWYRGKSHDTFAPTGPWLSWAPTLGDPGNLNMQLEVNGEVRQRSNTAEMIFGVPEVIEYISRTITLEPGDLIATGTPAGVGVFREPPLFLSPGDRVRGEIEKLGALEMEVAVG